MVGQDEFRLDERPNKSGDDDDGNGKKEFTKESGQREDGNESDDGGEDGKGDGQGHAVCAGDRCVDSGSSVFLKLGKDTFPDNDGIIDNDAEHENETKERCEIDTDADKKEPDQYRQTTKDDQSVVPNHRTEKKPVTACQFQGTLRAPMM